jgi:hypothetical protein
VPGHLTPQIKPVGHKEYYDTGQDECHKDQCRRRIHAGSCQQVGVNRLLLQHHGEVRHGLVILTRSRIAGRLPVLSPLAGSRALLHFVVIAIRGSRPATPVVIGRKDQTTGDVEKPFVSIVN